MTDKQKPAADAAGPLNYAEVVDQIAKAAFQFTQVCGSDHPLTARPHRDPGESWRGNDSEDDDAVPVSGMHMPVNFSCLALAAEMYSRVRRWNAESAELNSRGRRGTDVASEPARRCSCPACSSRDKVSVFSVPPESVPPELQQLLMNMMAQREQPGGEQPPAGG